MALTDLWTTDRAQLSQKRVHQIIAFAGEGRLSDDSVACKEFRDFLALVPTAQLSRYLSECLEDKFQDPGLALQDIVNQMGRRLGFYVVDGRYRGKQGTSGHDGLWRLPNDHTIVVEVKTTDAYRIDLNVLAGYRTMLANNKQIDPAKSSMLIIVGRQDTGDLEAQIRGSRHAWDIRLISVESILRLVLLKEAVDDPQVLQKVHALLIPREFTRLDEIVDIVFSTAEGAASEDDVPDTVADEPDEPAPVAIKATGPKFIPVKFHDACVLRLEKQLGTTFVKRSRSTFVSPDDSIRVTCSVSKKHDFVGDESYWFAYHDYTTEFLQGAKSPFAAFGCGSAHTLFLFPLATFQPLLPTFYRTKRDDTSYAHVQIYREGERWFLKRKPEAGSLDVTQYLITPETASSGNRP